MLETGLLLRLLLLRPNVALQRFLFFVPSPFPGSWFSQNKEEEETVFTFSMMTENDCSIPSVTSTEVAKLYYNTNTSDNFHRPVCERAF